MKLNFLNFRNWFLIAACGLVFAGVFGGGVIRAQSPSPSPTVAPSPGGENNLSSSMRRLGTEATKLTPILRDFESALMPFIMSIAWLGAVFLFWLFFATLLKRQEGADKEFFFWLVSCVFIFMVLAYSGNADHNGRQSWSNGPDKYGDMVDYVRGIGNALAYGNPDGAGGADGTGNFLSSEVAKARIEYNKAIKKTSEKSFMVKSAGNPNGDTNFAVLDSGGQVTSDVVKGLSTDNWNLADVREWFDVSRGLFEIADLFLLLLGAFLGSLLRIAFPLAVACAIHKDLRAQVTRNFIWAGVVITVFLPIFTQILRLFAYHIVVVMATPTNPETPFYQQAQNGDIIANGDPVYPILLMCLTMGICAAALFTSPYLIFRVTTGEIVENLGNSVSGMFNNLTHGRISQFSNSAVNRMLGTNNGVGINQTQSNTNNNQPTQNRRQTSLTPVVRPQPNYNAAVITTGNSATTTNAANNSAATNAQSKTTTRQTPTNRRTTNGTTTRRTNSVKNPTKKQVVSANVNQNPRTMATQGFTGLSNLNNANQQNSANINETADFTVPTTDNNKNIFLTNRAEQQQTASRNARRSFRLNRESRL